MASLEARLDELELDVARLAPLEAELKQIRADWEEAHRALTKELADLRARTVRHRKAIGALQGALNEHGQILSENSKVIGELQKDRLEHRMAIRELWGNQLELSQAIGCLRAEFGALGDEVLLGMAGIQRSLDQLISAE